MAGADRMTIEEVVRKVLLDEHADVIREAVKAVAAELMELEVSELIGAERGERRPEDRATHRNGYRQRRWDTRRAAIGAPTGSTWRQVQPGGGNGGSCCVGAEADRAAPSRASPCWGFRSPSRSWLCRSPGSARAMRSAGLPAPVWQGRSCSCSSAARSASRCSPGT